MLHTVCWCKTIIFILILVYLHTWRWKRKAKETAGDPSRWIFGRESGSCSFSCRDVALHTWTATDLNAHAPIQSLLGDHILEALGLPPFLIDYIVAALHIIFRRLAIKSDNISNIFLKHLILCTSKFRSQLTTIPSCSLHPREETPLAETVQYQEFSWGVKDRYVTERKYP